MTNINMKKGVQYHHSSADCKIKPPCNVTEQPPQYLK